MKKILFLNRYSNHSPRVYRYALKIAQYTNAHVLLAHIFQGQGLAVPNNELENSEDWTAFFQNKIEQQYEIEMQRLKNFARKHAAKQSESIALEFEVSSGIPTDEVLNIAKNHEVDLIVMGSKSPNNFWSAVSGNLTPNMIDKADCPILLVPPIPIVEFLGFSKIVYATDFLNPDRKNVNKLLDWVKIFKSELHIIHVKGNEKKHPEALENMKYLIQDILGVHFDEKIHFKMLKGNVKEEILHYLEKSDARIIAMTTEHRGFWGHLFDPSLTKKIAGEALIPILVFKKN